MQHCLIWDRFSHGVLKRMGQELLKIPHYWKLKMGQIHVRELRGFGILKIEIEVVVLAWRCGEQWK